MSDEEKAVVTDPELEEIIKDETPPEKEGEVESSGEGEVPEKKDKEEVVEPTQEEIDAASVYPRPKFKDIVNKYPSFFKDFPDLRQAFFREQKFTEIFPTIEEAASAQEASEDYQVIVADLQDGKIANILEVLEDDQLKTVASAFLPELYKKDQNVYFAITGSVLDTFLKNAYKAAEQSGDEDLKASAQWLAKWAFGDFAFATGGKSVQPLNNKSEENGRKKLEEEKQTYENQKFYDNYTAIVDAGLRGLRNHIVSGLSDVTSATLKNMIIKAVEEEVSNELERDTSHVRRMDALWLRARKAGFVGDSKSRILTTYLARAKSLVPAIRSKVKAEVLGQAKIESSEQQTTTTMPSGGQVRVTNKVPSDPKKIDWSKTSDMDLIKGSATIRR